MGGVRGGLERGFGLGLERGLERDRRRALGDGDLPRERGRGEDGIG